MPTTFNLRKLQLLALILPLILSSFAIEGCKSKKQTGKSTRVTSRPPREKPEPEKTDGPEDKTKESSENTETANVPEPHLEEKTNDHVDVKEEAWKSENLTGKSQEERFPEEVLVILKDKVINEIPEQIAILREAINTYGIINATRKKEVMDEKKKIHDLMVQIKTSVDLLIQSGDEKSILFDIDFLNNIDEYNELVADAMDARATYRRYFFVRWWKKNEPVFSPGMATKFLIVFPEIDKNIFSEITSSAVTLLFRDRNFQAPDDENIYLNLASEISNLEQTEAFIELLENGVTDHFLYEKIVEGKKFSKDMSPVK